jgi:hypothetical protein
LLADIAWRRADVTVNLGDICASPLWPREIFERLESLKLPTVRGNHDRWMAERPREKLGWTMGYEYEQLLPAQRGGARSIAVFEGSRSGTSCQEKTDHSPYLRLFTPAHAQFSSS